MKPSSLDLSMSLLLLLLAAAAMVASLPQQQQQPPPGQASSGGDPMSHWQLVSMVNVSSSLPVLKYRYIKFHYPKKIRVWPTGLLSIH